MALVDAVIFDLGNVLVFHDNPLLFRRLAERSGYRGTRLPGLLSEGPLWEDLSRGGVDEEGIRRAVCRELGADIPMAEFFELWSCHFRLNDPMLPMVERLVGRVKLVLLSNTNALHVAFLRPKLPVLQRFDAVLVSNELGLVKPEAAFFHAALERAGTPADRTAFFDDHPTFVEAAKKLGIRGHVYTDASAFQGQLRALGLAE
jgi:glucose-1-phosphatase